MNTKTIYTSQTETRTFTVGEVFTMHIGAKSYRAEVVSLDGGIFELRPVGDTATFHMLGMSVAKSLTPWRVALEQLNEPRRRF